MFLFGGAVANVNFQESKLAKKKQVPRPPEGPPLICSCVLKNSLHIATLLLKKHRVFNQHQKPQKPCSGASARCFIGLIFGVDPKAQERPKEREEKTSVCWCVDPACVLAAIRSACRQPNVPHRRQPTTVDLSHCRYGQDN